MLVIFKKPYQTKVQNWKAMFRSKNQRILERRVGTYNWPLHWHMMHDVSSVSLATEASREN